MEYLSVLLSSRESGFHLYLNVIRLQACVISTVKKVKFPCASLDTM